MTEWIGWGASALLFLTMAIQVRKQWTSHAVAGVSPLLFIGQVSASALFTVYSVLTGDTVFIAVNSFMLANALVGLYIDRRNRAHADAPKPALSMPEQHRGGP